MFAELKNMRNAAFMANLAARWTLPCKWDIRQPDVDKTENLTDESQNFQRWAKFVC
jgi:hypothetical protein